MNGMISHEFVPVYQPRRCITLTVDVSHKALCKTKFQVINFEELVTHPEKVECRHNEEASFDCRQ